MGNQIHDKDFLPRLFYVNIPMMKKSILFFTYAIVIATIMLAVTARFYKIGEIPYGFHVDEFSDAVTVGCMATQGVDAQNRPYPLFGELNYGTPKPPTYLYPAVLWAKVFGFTVKSLRTFSAGVHVLGIIGLFFLARQFLGARAALIAVLAAGISPWVWVPCRIAFESLFAVTFMIWGLYFFLKHSRWAHMLAGVFFACAMYAYPPMRVQVPLMIMALMVYRLRTKTLNLKFLAVFLLPLFILLVPLIQKTVSGEIQGRFNSISIFSKDFLTAQGKTTHLKDVAGIFMENYAAHFKPDFLFSKGDPSYVHSTRHFGILSWLDMAALGVGVFFVFILAFKKCRHDNPLVVKHLFLGFLGVNILCAVVPSALTNSELPNSLRIVGAWPFMCLFTGFILGQAVDRWWVLWPVVMLVAALFMGMFLRVYFKTYPLESKGMFSFWTLEEANRIKSDEDWFNFLARYRHEDYHSRYFLMQYRGISCKESKTIWKNINGFLNSQGQK